MLFNDLAAFSHSGISSLRLRQSTQPGVENAGISRIARLATHQNADQFRDRQCLAVTACDGSGEQHAACHCSSTPVPHRVRISATFHDGPGSSRCAR